MSEPAPDPTQALLDLVGAQSRGTLATIKRDGLPQLSVVSHHLDRAAGVVRVSTREGLAKTANLRRDPRASLLVHSDDQWAYAVVEGAVEVSTPAAAPDDEVVEALVELYRAIAGEHPDWADYRRAMVDERRVVVTIDVDHVYGIAR